MATPNEIEILRMIQRNGQARNKEVARQLKITSGYAEFLMATMAKNGWLAKEKGVGYVLASAGVDELISEFVYSKDRLLLRVDWMQKQVEKIDGEIERLEIYKDGIKEVSGV